jgi:NADH dehydrogenase (ubiquinone) Fe-S protein 4
MSLLRPSIAGRLLRASVPSTRHVIPGTLRFESTALGTPHTSSETPPAELTKAGEAKDFLPRQNQPNYTAEVDQASS